MARDQKSHGLRLVRWIGLAMSLPALFAVVLLGQNAANLVEGIDDTALKREAAAVQRGVALMGDLHATELLSLAMWDEAFQKVVVSKQRRWIKENFGRDALQSDGEQELVIVDAAGHAIFSSRNGDAPSPERAAHLLAAAGPAMERARVLFQRAHAEGDGFGERMSGALTDGIYVSDLARIDGKPAMITVAPITPDVDDFEVPKDPTLLVGIQVMTPAMLGKLEALSHVEGLRHVAADHEATTGEHALALTSTDGAHVTHLTWTFSPPGSAVLAATAPAIGASLALVVLLTWIGTATVRRLTRKLAESEAAAVHASRHDAATGLANRGWFMRVFADMLQAPREADTVRAVMLIDCDYFKAVNDTLGHAAGDAVLNAIATRLKAEGHAFDIAARLGGDEFALITAPLAHVDDASDVAEQVRTRLMQPVRFEGHVIPVSVSIGVATAVAPGDGDLDAILVRADLALYRAKRDGRGCARTYDADIDTGETSAEEATAMMESVRQTRGGKAPGSAQAA